VRQRAIRGRWQRSRGNDGKARVRLPEGITERTQTPSEHRSYGRTNTDQTGAERLIAILQDHIATLKSDLHLARDQLAEERQVALEAIEECRRLTLHLAELRAAHIPSKLGNFTSLALVPQFDKLPVTSSMSNVRQRPDFALTNRCTL
jgi:hypothetical protein